MGVKTGLGQGLTGCSRSLWALTKLSALHPLHPHLLHASDLSPGNDTGHSKKNRCSGCSGPFTLTSPVVAQGGMAQFHADSDEGTWALS